MRRKVCCVLALAVALFAPTARGAAQTDSSAEITFWNSVKDSRNPAEISAYLDKYPNGTFAPLAKIRLESLKPKSPAPPTEQWAAIGFALLLATARRVTESEHFLRAGRWTHWAYDMFAGADVHGATLGVLGMGRIGQAIARRGALGFCMKVVYHNRSRLSEAEEAAIGARWLSLPELMAQADHLVIVVPYSAATHHLVGPAQLALMKPTATLTNIARGGVVDDAALAEALKAGQLAAAGLDVFEGEPQVHPALLTLPNVVLTPHIASASLATRRAMAELAADNLIAALTGGQPLTPLNPEVLAKA